MYNRQWRQAQQELEQLTTIDFEIQAQDAQFDRVNVQRTLFELYARYIVLSNRLEDVYDQIMQPQKRILVRSLLDGCLGRVVELKHDLVAVEMAEFNYNDDVMHKLGLTSRDVESRVPRYFKDREDEIRQRQRFIDDIYTRMGWNEGEGEAEERMNELQAIKIIQMHERARQGRLRAQFMREIRQLKEKGAKDGSGRGGPGSGERDMSGLLAAMRIQKMWRGFTTRKRTRRRKMEEMVLIGMVPPPPHQQKAAEAEIKKAEKLREMRYELQKQHFEDFRVALSDTKDEISVRQGSVLTEEISDEIRQWLKEYHQKSGKFPDFPSEDAGGSRHMLSRQGTESEISRSSAYSSKGGSAKGKSASAGKERVAKTGDLNAAEDPGTGLENGFKASQSLFLPELKTGVDEFNDVWRSKDESGNPHQTYYEEMVFADKYQEVEAELRRVVDDVMRQELELLQAALDRDRATKGKKAKKSSKKARRSGKKGKKKKEKDLTPDRTTESLLEELVLNGVIKRCPETKLSDFLGDRSFVQRTSGLNPAPGDIRQVLMEYAVLPLGSEAVRNYAPCVRSLLLAGPRGSGKRLLVHAICSETGATLFDLTPQNLAGKYPGKSGLIMLMHLVSKVSRLLQPSVIFMGDAERPFMKKIPKTDRTDPKRLKKDLPKLIKNLGPEDRVLFIGTSCCPWDADQKLLQQTYNHFIYIPRPDYGTLSFAWRHFLSPYNQQLDTGAMAKVSDGYTIGAIVQCVREVITCKRMLQLRVQPLTHVELINSLW